MDKKIEEARQRLINANVPETQVDDEIAEARAYQMTDEFLCMRLNHLAVVAEKKLENDAGSHTYMAQFQE